ncbi:hypothetical protein E2C01_092261 [Portunus trituberculatus]|uniref:Uncharacterized protein n=1 Tax=Portunus trituberculatus TaxID=210409 RepID=A0A5B7JRJ5_PORTR|nr:hypothetical protein [Portunus trituberculatus]
MEQRAHTNTCIGAHCTTEAPLQTPVHRHDGPRVPSSVLLGLFATLSASYNFSSFDFSIAFFLCLPFNIWLCFHDLCDPNVVFDGITFLSGFYPLLDFAKRVRALHRDETPIAYLHS